MTKQITLKFPIEFPVNEIDEEILKIVKEIFVLEFLRKGKISQGKAAELLEISRYDLFDLMAKYDIPAFEATKEELKEGLKNLKEALMKK